MLAHSSQELGGVADLSSIDLRVGDQAVPVIGVLPPIPQFPVEHDVYMPTSACPFRAASERNMAGNRNAFRAMAVFARLDDGRCLAAFTHQRRDDLLGVALACVERLEATRPPLRLGALAGARLVRGRVPRPQTAPAGSGAVPAARGSSAR